MKILIVGTGKVGYSLAQQLEKEHHDIVIIDNDDEPLNHASETLDVLVVKGNGASFATLRNAGAETADIIIAATNSDEVNMLCCQSAKTLGTKFSIARIRDVDYTKDVRLLQEKLGIDVVINPELATATEISRLLRFPSANNIETFYRGRLELLSFRLKDTDFLVGQPLSAMSTRVRTLPFLICAAQRGPKIIVPNGSFIPSVGDKLYVLGEYSGIARLFKLLGRETSMVHSTFIVGGGRIAYYLADLMIRLNVKVKIVEMDMNRCRQLSESLPKALIINGNGTDQELLEAENVHRTDSFVALTDRDEDNLIIGMYAMLQGVPKVIAKSNRDNCASIAASVGLESLLSPKLITANRILQIVRSLQNSKSSVMTGLYRIADSQVEALQFEVNASTRNLGVPLKDVSLKPGILIAAVVSHGKVTFPEGSTSIHEGDTVIVVSQDEVVLDMNDIFTDAPAKRKGTEVRG